MLPFADDYTLLDLEDNVTKLPPVSDMLAAKMHPTEVCKHVLAGLGVSDPSFSQREFMFGPCEEDNLKVREYHMVAGIQRSDNMRQCNLHQLRLQHAHV